MLYLDYVVDSLLKIIDQNTENAIVLYTADHGKNIYDEGGNLGHDYAGKLSRSAAVALLRLDLAKINSAVFVPEKSLVNSRFDSTRKRILEDGFDYDEER